MATVAQAESRPPYRRLTDLAERALPASFLLLVQRLGVAAVFLQSGRTKVAGLFTIPETTLEALAAGIQRRLGIRSLRVVGDPKARVSRIQLGVGYATPAANVPDVDVVISGEQQEVDGFLDAPEYVADAAALRLRRGWIMLGHNVSEEAGMLEMARWIQSLVPEVPVQLIKSGEPFWAPD